MGQGTLYTRNTMIQHIQASNGTKKYCDDFPSKNNLILNHHFARDLKETQKLAPPIFNKETHPNNIQT
jgi:hypothetical protein